jgi:PAS domain S-box-containing protein
MMTRTERRTSDLSLVNELHRSIVAEAREGIVVYDRELRYQVWNRAMEEITGLPAARMLGRCVLECFPHLRTLGVDRMIERALRGEVVTTPELRHEINGRTIWLSAKYGPRRDASGEVIGVIGLVQNITERKQVEERLRQSEARYRMLVEDAVDILYDTDVSGNIVAFNVRAAYEVLGLTPEEIVGKHYLEFVIPSHRAEVQAFYERQFRTRTAVTYYEVPVQTKDGRLIWLGKHARLRTDGSGWIHGFHVVARDVTERRAREAELERSQALARRLSAHLQNVSETERARIAREIHDELGSGLTALRIRLSNCAEGLPSAPGSPREKIADLIAETDALIASVRGIANRLRPSILDTLGLWDAIEWQAEEFEGRTGIPCRLALEADDVQLDADRATAVFRIVQEALTNVTRHAQASEVRIAAHDRHGRLIVEVNDNGKGIAPEDLGRHSSFGLLGMEERARAAGGTLTVQGKPGKGTRIQLTMPIE